MSDPGEVSDHDARAVLAGHGREVGKRGRLSAGQWEEYHAIMAGGNDSPGDGDHVTDLGDPLEHASTPVNESSSSAPVDAEQPPRRIGQQGMGGRIRGLWERRPRGEQPPPPRSRSQNKKAGARKRKPEQPWRSTAAVIEHTWARLAQAAGALPPLQRILAVQAPLAGIVFEGQLRETFIDRVLLQPAARFEAQGEALCAMLGVPAFTVLTAMRGKAQTTEGPDGQPVILFKPDGSPAWDTQTELGMITPLRYCLISWLQVSERHADEVIAQAEATVRQGKHADQIIAWIFAPPDASMSFEDVSADARQRAEDFTRGAPPPDGPGPARGSSAFRPAITASVLVE